MDLSLNQYLLLSFLIDSFTHTSKYCSRRIPTWWCPGHVFKLLHLTFVLFLFRMHPYFQVLHFQFLFPKNSFQEFLPRPRLQTLYCSPFYFSRLFRMHPYFQVLFPHLKDSYTYSQQILSCKLLNTVPFRRLFAWKCPGRAFKLLHLSFVYTFQVV